MIGNIILTQYNGIILGPIAKILGILMNLIFNFLDLIGIPNIGLSIILFTVVIYLCLMPLTIKQQKFSKLSAIMNPELKAIQEKYKGKKDQDSMVAQNEEMQAVYKKYGVSPSGSCVQLIIQMPILFALYRVIYNVPAYVDKVKEALLPLASEIIDTKGASEFVQGFSVTRQLTYSDFSTTNGIIDILNRASSAEWESIYEKFPQFDSLTYVYENFKRYNNFLGLNISDSPWFIIKDSMAAGKYLLIIGALLIPALAAATQWVNTLFMPQQQNSPDGDNQMMQSMKMMNTTMPLISAFFCFTLPCGMGIYWIAGAVIRSIQQVIINKRIDKIDMDALIEKNKAKYEKAQKKNGLSYGDKIKKMASASAGSSVSSSASSLSQKEKEEKIARAKEFYASHGREGSIASKVNLVDQYNRNNEVK